MSKLLRRYLKEQNAEQGAAINQAFNLMSPDVVRRAASQSGVDFDKLPPEIQTKVSDIITRWGQNQTAYQQLSDREAQLATQIDALTNQPDTPDKQAALNQLNNQLVSTRSELDQVKASSAEIDAMGKEIEPVVTQLRDTGQAAMAPPDQTPEAPPPATDMAPAPPEQGVLGTAADYWKGKAPEMAATGKEMLGTAKDWATKQVTTPPPEGAAPPDMPQTGAGQMEMPPPAPEGMPPPPPMHQGTLQNIPQMSVPAHGSSYQPAAVAPPPQPEMPPPQPEMPPPPAPPQPEMAAPPEAPPAAPPEAGGAEGGMGDAAAGAAAVGIAGAAVMGAYKIYKQFFSKAARACANAPSKDECMQSYRDHGVQAAVNNLKRQIPKCGNDQDCAQKLQMAIKKLESNLGA